MRLRAESRNERRHRVHRSWRRFRLTRRFQVYREQSALRLPQRRHSSSGRAVRPCDPFRGSSSADMSRFTIDSPPPATRGPRQRRRPQRGLQPPTLRHPHRRAGLRQCYRPQPRSTCADRGAGGLLGAPARRRQPLVDGFGRQPAPSRHDQAAAVRPARVGRRAAGARLAPLPHHGMVTPEAERRRPAFRLPLERPVRRPPPAGRAERGGAAPRPRERPDRNGPWAIIGQVELCGRSVLTLRHLPALLCPPFRPFAVRACHDRKGGNASWSFLFLPSAFSLAAPAAVPARRRLRAGRTVRATASCPPKSSVPGACDRAGHTRPRFFVPL